MVLKSKINFEANLFCENILTNFSIAVPLPRLSTRFRVECHDAIDKFIISSTILVFSQS